MLHTNSHKYAPAHIATGWHNSTSSNMSSCSKLHTPLQAEEKVMQREARPGLRKRVTYTRTTQLKHPSVRTHCTRGSWWRGMIAHVQPRGKGGAQCLIHQADGDKNKVEEGKLGVLIGFEVRCWWLSGVDLTGPERFLQRGCAPVCLWIPFLIAAVASSHFSLWFQTLSLW